MPGRRANGGSRGITDGSGWLPGLGRRSCICFPCFRRLFEDSSPRPMRAEGARAQPAEPGRRARYARRTLAASGPAAAITGGWRQDPLDRDTPTMTSDGPGRALLSGRAHVQGAPWLMQLPLVPGAPAPASLLRASSMPGGAAQGFACAAPGMAAEGHPAGGFHGQRQSFAEDHLLAPIARPTPFC